MSIKKYDIILSTGGTGGHIFPALAVAEILLKQRPESSILFVGSKYKMEMNIISQFGYDVIGLPIKGLERKHIWKNITLPFAILRSLIISFKILRKNPIRIVMGFGGFASFCIVKVAQWMNISTFIHEQNSYPGIANKLLAKGVQKVFVGFQNMEKFFPKHKILFTGNPVRENIRTLVKDKQTEKQSPSRKYKIFIVGGSLGAEAINQYIQSEIAWFIQNKVELFWQVGERHYAKYQNLHNGSKGIHVLGYVSNIEEYYKRMDIVVSRAGAMAIAELAILAKPTILIPLSSATENHQLKNALNLYKQEACLLVQQDKMQTDFLKALKSLIQDASLRKKLSNNFEKLRIIDAHTRISHYLNSYFEMP